MRPTLDSKTHSYGVPRRVSGARRRNGAVTLAGEAAIDLHGELLRNLRRVQGVGGVAGGTRRPAGHRPTWRESRNGALVIIGGSRTRDRRSICDVGVDGRRSKARPRRRAQQGGAWSF